jgi:hypothetical protein
VPPAACRFLRLELRSQIEVNRENQFINNNSMTNILPSDWFSIVDGEEGEQLVSVFIEELIQRSQEVIFERHIESQVLPYAVNFAKDTIVDIIEVYAFMSFYSLLVELFQTR